MDGTLHIISISFKALRGGLYHNPGASLSMETWGMQSTGPNQVLAAILTRIQAWGGQIMPTIY